MAAYVGQPCARHLHRSSAAFSAAIPNEITQVVNGALLTMLHIGYQRLIALAMIILLMLVDPVLALVTALLRGGGFFLVRLAVRYQPRKMVQARRETDAQRFQVARDVRLRAMAQVI